MPNPAELDPAMLISRLPGDVGVVVPTEGGAAAGDRSAHVQCAFGRGLVYQEQRTLRSALTVRRRCLIVCRWRSSRAPATKRAAGTSPVGDRRRRHERHSSGIPLARSVTTLRVD
jgi:hypothetical protein